MPMLSHCHNSPHQAVVSKRRSHRQPNHQFQMLLVGVTATGRTTMSLSSLTFKPDHLTTPIQTGVVAEDGAQVRPEDGTQEAVGCGVPVDGLQVEPVDGARGLVLEDVQGRLHVHQLVCSNSSNNRGLGNKNHKRLNFCTDTK